MKNKYSLIPDPSLAVIEPRNVSLQLEFKQRNGRTQLLDFQFFIRGLHPKAQIAKAVTEVFWLCMHSAAPHTRNNIRWGLMAFNRFLDWRAKVERRQVTSTLDFTKELLIEFQGYLAALQSEVTCHTMYTQISAFLTRVHELRPHYLPANFNVPPNPFLRITTHSSNQILAIEDLVKITLAAQREVDRIRELRQLTLQLLREGEANDELARMPRKPRNFWKSKANAVYYIIRVVGINNWNKLNDINSLGPKGVSAIIKSYAPIGEEVLIPFLVLLFVKTAINVTSLFNLSRDCLAEHPLPLGLTVLKYKKYRSGARSDHEQSFPTTQKNGVVDLIRFLLQYTEPWIEHAAVAERQWLFLYRQQEGVATPMRSFAAAGLRKFITRNNLHSFTFDQLRPTMASLLFVKTRDIFKVQRLLGHSLIRTTLKYVRGALVQSKLNIEIREGIDRMVEEFVGGNARVGGVSVFNEPLEDVIAKKIKVGELPQAGGDRMLSGGCRTLLAQCKDPLNSPQPGELKGRVCRSLHSCLFCENCWIFAEDLADVVRYRNTLEAERADMSVSLWNEVHAEAVREINESILTSFPSQLVVRAELDAQRLR